MTPRRIRLAAAGTISLWEEPPADPTRHTMYHVRRRGRWLATSYRRGEARAQYRLARRGEPVEGRWSEEGLFLARWAGRRDDEGM